MILKGQEIFDRVMDSLKHLEVPREALAIVQVGNDRASTIYINKKLEAAKKLGVDARVIRFNDEITQSELTRQIELLNQDKGIGGIIIQIPLPSQIDRNEICARIIREKDVDGFGYIVGQESPVIPPTILAIDKTLDFYSIKKTDKKILIVGAGFLVGSPLYRYYRSLNLDVSLLNEGDDLYFEKLQEADIVILATGGGAIFDHSHFAQGSVVVDASTIASDSKLYGDLETSLIGEKFSYSPVPGGVGPVTVAMLFANFYLLCGAKVDL